MVPPLLTLADDAREFTVEAGTFSKSFSPGIRVGWGVLPEHMVAPVLAMKSGIDFGSPHFSQALMTSVLKSGMLLEHLPVIRDAYRAKRDVTLEALQEHLGDIEGVQWRTPRGGLYVWLQLPAELDASESGPLWPAATTAGVLYVPGHHCFASEGCDSGENTIRLSYGVLDADGLREGIRRLATAIKACLAVH
jgi:2-aminoadipate transaminase